MSAQGQERKTIDPESERAMMEKGIGKLVNILEGKREPQFDSENYMTLYTTIYNMCTQKPSHDYSQQLYDKYREAFEKYIKAAVLPAIKEKHDEFMLRELFERWSNHKIMVQWLSRFFHYLDRYFITRRSLTALRVVGLNCFRDLIFQEIKVKVKDAVIVLIDQERLGEHIDRDLLKNVLDVFVEIGLTSMECYDNDFEDFLLKDTTSYYSVKAQSWIIEDSCPNYMIKAEECLKKEKERVGHYLHINSEPKLLEVEDLSRMYRLFSKITCGLEPFSNMFKTVSTIANSLLALLSLASIYERRAISTLHREATKGQVSVSKGSRANPLKAEGRALKAEGRAKLLTRDMLHNIGRGLPARYIARMKLMCKSFGSSLDIGGPSLVLSSPSSSSSRLSFLKIDTSDEGIPILKDADYLHPPTAGSSLCWGAANGLMALHNKDLNRNLLHCPMCGFQIPLTPVPANMSPKGIYFCDGSPMLVIMEMEAEEEVVRLLHLEVYDDDESAGAEEDIELLWALYPGAEGFNNMQCINFSDSMLFVAISRNSDLILNRDRSSETDSSGDDEEGGAVDEGSMIELQIIANDEIFTQWPINGCHVFSCHQDIYVCCLLRSSQNEAIVKAKNFQLVSMGDHEFSLVEVNSIGLYSVFLGSNQAVVLPSSESSVGRQANTVYVENFIGAHRAFQILGINLETQAVTVIPFPADVTEMLIDDIPAAWVNHPCAHCQEDKVQTEARIQTHSGGGI